MEDVGRVVFNPQISSQNLARAPLIKPISSFMRFKNLTL